MRDDIIIARYDGQPKMPDGTRFIGNDKYGFRYYMAPDNYVYQVYPATDYMENGINHKNMFNGWIASGPAWESTIHKILQ